MPRLWTRREATAALLGWPIAVAGCQGPSPEQDIDGRIVGPSMEFGHRMRDGFRPQPAEDQWRQTEVVVVGGGAAGLAAARRLHEGGLRDFVVLELESALGGTSRSDSSGRTPYPWGAHYLPAPMAEDAALIDLLREVGAVEGTDELGQPVFAEHHLCRDPEERVFYKGRWYEGLYLHAGASADDQAQLQRFLGEVQRWVDWRDLQGRRAFRVPMELGSDDPQVTELDRRSMADWLDAGKFTSPRLRWLIDYSCRDDYGLRTEQTSAYAGLFYFAARVQKSASEPQPLLTWPEGNGRLISALAGNVKDQLRPGWGVCDVRFAEQDDQDQALVSAVDQQGQVQGFRCRRVVFAAPQFLARHLLEPWRREPPVHLSAFTYGSWLVANVFLKDRPASLGFPLSWDNVLYESPSLGYVTATHQQGFDHGPTVWTYYYPFCEADPRQARKRLLELDWQSAADVVLADLSRAHPGLRPLVQRIDVMRWGHAMIRPTPGFLWGPHRRLASQPYRCVHFAHSDLSGLALFEEAFHHGRLAADEVLQALGRPIQS